MPRKSGRSPRDARAYIRALGSAHCSTPAMSRSLSASPAKTRTSSTRLPAFPQPSHFEILRPFSQPNAKLVIDSLTEATSPAETTSNEETMGSNEQFGINHCNIHQGCAEEVTYTGILHSYWSILSQSAGSAAPFYHNLQGLQGTLRQKRLWPEGIRIHQRNVVSSLPKEKTVRLASVYASYRKRACILQTKYPLDHFYTWISAFNCLEQYSAELACVRLPTLNSFYSCDKPS